MSVTSKKLTAGFSATYCDLLLISRNSLLALGHYLLIRGCCLPLLENCFPAFGQPSFILGSYVCQYLGSHFSNVGKLCANIWGYYSLMLGRYSQILGVANRLPKLAKLTNSFRFFWASTEKEADAGDMKNADILLLLLSLEFWFYWSKVRPYQNFGPTLVPTIQTSCNILPLAFDSRRRNFKQSGTHGG